MSAHRSLARLPLDIFDGLQQCEVPLSGEDLRREIVGKLKIGRFVNAGSLLRLSPTSLLKALDPLLTYQECHEFYRRTCIHCAPKPVSALNLLHQTHDDFFSQQPPNNNNNRTATSAAVMRFLPTGLQSLDKYLLGGLRVGTVVEVVGCAASGKTQLALQTAAVAAASHGQGSIFIDTEKKVSLSRLQEIAAARAARNNTGHDDDVVLRNVSVHSPGNMQELLTVLDSLEQEILVRNEQQLEGDATATSSCLPVRLLVIDSIAAPARLEFGTGSAAAQASTVLQIAQTVKRLADQFQLAALIINQVGTGTTSINSSNNNSRSAQPLTNALATNATKAALGTAWHHCVSTRIQLEQHHHASAMGTTNTEDHGESQKVVRTATVVKSNLVGPSEPLGFQVTTEGLVDEV